MRVKLPVSNSEYCEICGCQASGMHHVYEGSNRRNSEKWGCKFPVCVDCHTAGADALHRNDKALRYYKALYQRRLEAAGWTRSEFVATMGRNYL
jgi:hypothetical protein